MNSNLGNGPIPAYLAHFAEIAFNAVIAFDSKKKITYWNPAAEKLYGWSAREAVGKTYEELFGHGLGANQQERLKHRLDNIERGEIIRGEYNFRHKDGSLLSIEYTARLISDREDSFTGYLTVHRDITESKRADEKISRLNADLQTQLDEHESLMEILPIAIWTGNHDCSIITGNPAAYRTMGLPPGINVSLSNPGLELPLGLRIFVNGVEVAPEDAPMQTVARTGLPLYNFEHEFLFPDQTRKIFYASIAPVFDEQGTVRKVIAAYVDFTERKLAEEQLRLAREYAEQTADRLNRLQKVTAALSEAVTPAQVAEVVVNLGASALGATSGTVMLISEDGEALETVQYAAPEDLIRPYKRFPLSLKVPAADAVHSGHPVWLESRHQYLDRYPHLSDQISAWGKQAAVAIPMIVDERTLGVMTLSFDQILPQTAENLGFALTIARQGAQALERARLYRQTQQALSELQMTYDQSPIGMIQLDTDLRYQRVNETLARYNGIPADVHIGKSIHEIVPDMAPQIEEGVRRVMETGEPVFNIEVVGETKADPGVPHTWLESWYPLREDGGQVVGLNIVVQDITDRKRDEQALTEFARQQEALYTLADKLHRTSSLKGAFDAVLDAILDALQCDRASILLFDESDVMRFVAWRGLSSAYRTATEGHSPWKSGEKDTQPVCFNDVEDAGFEDALKSAIQAEGIASLAFIPLVFDGKLIGKFVMYFDAPHIFDANEVDFSLTVAHQLAFGIQRMRAEESLRIRARQQQAVAKLGELALRERKLRNVFHRATAMIAETLSVEYCKVLKLVEDGKSLLLLEGVGWKDGLVGSATVSASTDSQAGYTLWSDAPVVMDDLTKEQRFTGSPLLTEHGVISGMSCIIRGADGVPWGVLGTYTTRRVSFTEDDVNFLVAVANILGDAIRREQDEEALRESEKQLQILNESLEQKVREQTAEVRKLASDLTKAEQRERRRIAHILHEDLQQRIYAIQMQVEFLLDEINVENSNKKNDFDRIKRQLREVVALTRHLSVDLSPPILRDEGLPQAVSWLSSQMEEQHGLHIELEVDDSFKIPNEDVRMLLFSCIRELLFNIVKHAGVMQAVVALQRSNGDLRVEVRDQGAGFDVAALAERQVPFEEEFEDELRSRSFGLPTIRHRLSLFGGQLVVQSKPNEGTVVIITIPATE